MAKRGDMVRFLNTTGGGKVTRVEGKLLYVEEDGFETPVLASEVVVVLPAGHEEAAKGAKLMFDQKAFNTGREEAAAQIQQPSPIVEEKPLPVEETSHGEKINITLAFEPADIKHLSTTRFNAVLVNDSNYFLSFTFLRRSEEERGWSVVYEGKVAPNELIDLASYTHETLTKIERVAIQAVAYKCDKEFSLKSPIGVSRRLDLTKFHKLHCFRPGVYFDNPVLELPMVKDDFAVKALEHPAEAVEEYSRKEPTLKDLAKKYEKPDRKKKGKIESPTKLLPLI